MKIVWKYIDIEVLDLRVWSGPTAWRSAGGWKRFD
jgi:hypothetical protein